MKNISWINWVKVISLFLIYFIHSENRINVPSDIRFLDPYILPYYVAVFFIISGYLLYKKQSDYKSLYSTDISWFSNCPKQFLSNILFRFFIPTCLFSIILFFPKIILRGQTFDCREFLQTALTGYNLWFVAALATAEIIVFIFFYKRKFSLLLFVFLGALLSVCSLILNKYGFDNVIWKYQSGMIAVLYLATGALYFKLEKTIYNCNKYAIEFLFVVGVLISIFLDSLRVKIDLSTPTFSLSAYFISVINSLVLIHYSKKLLSSSFVDFIGRNTIGVYFLSGALPETVGILFSKVFDNVYILIPIVTLVSFLLAIFINFLLVKYIPFLFDFRKLSK